jgi:hypothetical protein
VGLLNGLVRGTAAGAAGTTALNTATYLDMLGRGRGTSSTPTEAVERLADKSGIDIPGEGDSAENRASALGALQGILVGAGLGAVLGAARAAGLRPPLAVTALFSAAAAMVVTNGPMALLGVTDPREWNKSDWLSDAVPHLAYGLATAGTLAAIDPANRSGNSPPRRNGS